MNEWFERLRVPAAVTLVVIIGMALVSLVQPDQPAGSSSRSAPVPTATAAPRPIQVHVTGAVKAPNVYVLSTESRVRDALAAAGGPTADADPHRLNLAAFLRDGDQVLVPRAGEPQAGPAAALAASPAASSQGASGPGANGPGTAGLVDLNRASAAELEALPGIGKVTADKIIRSRETNGPFTSLDQLRERKLIGPATLDKIRDRLVVR